MSSMRYKLLGSIVLTAILSVITPTLSDISELVLIKKLYNKGYTIWGLCLFIPMLLNSICMVITWRKTTKTPKWSMIWWIELSLVKFYPQCKMAKILHLQWLEDPTHEEEQRMYGKYLSGKEKLLENLPQVFVKIGILAYAYLPKHSADKKNFQQLFGTTKVIEGLAENVENNVIKEIISFQTLFFITLFFTFFFSVFSVTTFFLEGRFKFIPSSSKFPFPFFSLNFVVTFISVGLSFFYKVWILGALLFVASGVYETTSIYNPLGSYIVGYDHNSDCKVVSLVQKSAIVGIDNFTEITLTNHSVQWADNAMEYETNGQIFFWQKAQRQWLTGKEDCRREEKKCSPITVKAYCRNTEGIEMFMHWTTIFIWYLLVVIPQLFIILSVLAWTRMLSTVYLHPELMIATMTSNFTFGPQYGWKRGSLALHNGLTWVMTTVSFVGLVFAVIILGSLCSTYRDDCSQGWVRFLLYGAHEDNDNEDKDNSLPIPPIYPLVSSVVAVFLAGWLLYMDKCLPNNRSRSFILPMKRSVYKRKRKERKPVDVACKMIEPKLSETLESV